MKMRTLKAREVEQAPHLLWNSFVDLLAMERYEDLTEAQRPAHLVFWYESEVYNGGHLQYFENRRTKYLEETIAALRLLRAECQRSVLQDAIEQFRNRDRERIETPQDYSEIALQGEFDQFDSRLSACDPDLMKRLEEYFSLHQSSFVIIVS